jgi:hypothetical protein
MATLSLCILAAAQTGCMTAVAAFQPENIGVETIVVTTTDADGESHERVLSPIDDDGRLFVAANHWPRAWYHRALENPEVRVTRNGETTDSRAVPVSEEERERLLDESGFRCSPRAPPGGAREPGRASGRAARSSAIRRHEPETPKRPRSRAWNKPRGLPWPRREAP